MAEGSDQRYERTRVQLHGLAEGLIAGPQYRSAGTIRLAVYADGFGGVVSPLSIRGGRFDWVDGAAPLAGTPRELARAAGSTSERPRTSIQLPVCWTPRRRSRSRKASRP